MIGYDEHPVDRLSDAELRALLMRVDTKGFPADLAHLWNVERLRYRETIRRLPPAADKHATLLDLGSSRPWLPFFQLVLGYRRLVLNTSYPDSGFVADGLTVDGDAPADVRMSVFDVERDVFPHDDASFDVVTCLEVLEHLAVDPMRMMAEVNRVLKPGGVFVLSTPNAIRCSNVVNIMLGDHPQGWAPYNGFDSNRHNREYTPSEIDLLYRAAGLTPSEVTTFGTKSRGTSRYFLRSIVSAMLLVVRRCPSNHRRDVILAVGKKTSQVVERRPSWLYYDMAERVHENDLQEEATASAPVNVSPPACDAPKQDEPSVNPPPPPQPATAEPCEPVRS